MLQGRAISREIFSHDVRLAKVWMAGELYRGGEREEGLGLREGGLFHVMLGEGPMNTRDIRV